MTVIHPANESSVQIPENISHYRLNKVVEMSLRRIVAYTEM
jgi:hypothetical protein